MEKHTTIEALACALANTWLHERRDDKLTNRMPPLLMRQLDALSDMTRGNNLRCFCVTGRDTNHRDHTITCPAWKP